MTSLLFTISLSALFSVASFLVILFRVSPLTAPQFALPFFFITLVLAVASVTTLIAYFVWSRLPIEGVDSGRKLTVSLREGMFLAIAIALVFLLHLLGVLTWWVAVLVFLVFALIELALHV